MGGSLPLTLCPSSPPTVSLELSQKRQTCQTKEDHKDKGGHGGRTFLGFIGSGISLEVHSPEVLTSAALPAAITDFADKLRGTMLELNLSLIEEPGKGWM